MSENSGFSGVQMFFAFLGGATAGAVTALLLAPQSGEKTRASIANKARELSDGAARVPRAISGAAGAARDAFADSITASAADHKHK